MYCGQEYPVAEPRPRSSPGARYGYTGRIYYPAAPGHRGEVSRGVLTDLTRVTAGLCGRNIRDDARNLQGIPPATGPEYLLPGWQRRPFGPSPPFALVGHRDRIPKPGQAQSRAAVNTCQREDLPCGSTPAWRVAYATFSWRTCLSQTDRGLFSGFGGCDPPSRPRRPTVSHGHEGGEGCGQSDAALMWSVHDSHQRSGSRVTESD